jgi:hypothetical protein
MRSKLSNLLVIFVAACGGGGGGAKAVDHPVEHAPKSVDHEEDSDPDDGLEIESTRGKLDQDEIDEGIEPHSEALQDCFLSRAGKAKWLGGKVEVKWVVANDGTLTSAQIAADDLGSWEVEKCILDESRAMTFPKPHGKGAANFSIPFEFDGGRQASWWDEEMAANVLSKHTADLDGCAAAAKTADPTDVTVTLYVGTRGKVQSVGFGSPALIDDAWAGCAVKKVMAWQLTDPKGKVVKLSFVYRQGETPQEEDEE